MWSSKCSFFHLLNNFIGKRFNVKDNFADLVNYTHFDERFLASTGGVYASSNYLANIAKDRKV